MNKNFYKFALPTYISFYIDESNVSIENINDLEKLQKKYDIDLQYVIDEYEYKMEMENEIADEDDFINLNDVEIFDSVIDELWNEITESFKTDVKLNQINKENIRKIYEVTSKHFNDTKNWDEFFQLGNITNIEMTDVDDKNSQFIVTVETNKELSDDKIESIRKFLDHQCSDGWGEEFENEDLSYLMNEDRSVFVKTWQPNSEVKYII